MVCASHKLPLQYVYMYMYMYVYIVGILYTPVLINVHHVREDVKYMCTSRTLVLSHTYIYTYIYIYIYIYMY